MSFLALGILITRAITKSSSGSAAFTRPLPCGTDVSPCPPSPHVSVKCSHSIVSPLAASLRTALKWAVFGVLLGALGCEGTATSSAPTFGALWDRLRNIAAAEPPSRPSTARIWKTRPWSPARRSSASRAATNCALVAIYSVLGFLISMPSPPAVRSQPLLANLAAAGWAPTARRWASHVAPLSAARLVLLSYLLRRVRCFEQLLLNC